MKSFIEYRFSLQELNVDVHNTAPLLGYEKTLPDDIFPLVKEVLDETSGLFDICGGYRIFDRIEFMSDKKHIRIEDVEFTANNLIYNQLKKSEQLAVFVCTAGNGIGQWSRQTMPDDPVRGFFADVLGSVVVETAIEAIHQKLNNDIEQTGLHITNRYSPGYCGWHTSEQHKLFSLFPKAICGITLTDTALMLPIKSVSGFIGIGAHVRFNAYTCRLCELTSCVYRNRKSRITNVS